MNEETINFFIERTSLPGEELGFPRIKGRRISVVDIVLWQQAGLSTSEIAQEYDLSEDTISAALAFYEQNKEEIDRYIEEGEAFFEAGLQAQQHDPIYLGLRIRREAIAMRERPDIEGYG
jgi:uncharacterized protein (DUF433 family)